MSKNTVCEKNLCTGCMACVSVCKKEAIKIKDGVQSYDAIIDERLCINCGMCKKVCPNNSQCIAKRPVEICQGWAINSQIRKKGASGGVCSEIMRSFIKNKHGVVVACFFNDGKFTFEVETSLEGIARFSGSKYVKSNPQKIFCKIKDILYQGLPVLFVGLPCQVAGLQNYLGEKRAENLYTIDLICHGTPSEKVLCQFLNEKKININDINDIKFREGSSFYLSVDGKPITYRNIMDEYSIAFMYGMTYTDSCYKCKYAKLDRVSDITLGDSWGSDLGNKEINNGVSLILCQSNKGKELLELAEIYTCPVDKIKAIQSNKQLQMPAIAHPKRKRVLSAVINKRNFSRKVFEAYPQKVIKQKIKFLLIKSRVMK